jgi:peptide/histidine transporter 3/4
MCLPLPGTEFVECLAFFGVAKKLVTYLTGELHESNVDAATNVSTWIGSCFLTPVIGAFLADTYWGRYRTLVIFLLIYTIVSCKLPSLLQYHMLICRC